MNEELIAEVWMYQTKFDLFSGSITNLADDVVAVDLFGELSTTPWIYTPQIAKEFVFAGDLHQPRARLLRLVAGIPCKLGTGQSDIRPVSFAVLPSVLVV